MGIKMKKELKSQYYDIYIPESISSYWENLYNKAINLLSFDSNIKIAELGCGPGLFAEFLYKKGYKNYWGIDFSKKCIELAKKRVPSYQFEIGNLYDKNIQNRFLNYDVFISLETFEHLTNDLFVIKAIPKGKEIIFSVPNKPDPAHVRFFKSSKSVIQRYSLIINFIKSQTIPGVRAKKFFLVQGIKL